MANEAKKNVKTPAKVDPVAAVRNAIEAMPAKEVKRPNRDVPTYLLWARALIEAVGDHEAALLATPMTPEADLTTAEFATFVEVGAQLTVLQDEQTLRQTGVANLSPAQQKDYAAARGVEEEVVAVIRFAFRGDRKVRAWCRQVLRGDGVADLHDDARQLTAFVAKEATALAAFGSLGASVAQMNELAARLPTLAAPDAAANRRHTRLRNAAWTMADAIAQRICTGGRFALRADAAEAKRFMRLKPTRAKKKAAVAPPDGGTTKK